ncbi:MAG TPA: UDP-glucose/GDP-mannose dehydrogenase family protein [Candidatus Hydrogenedentes bacterium]|nr:UDP-glucose/GDP-mannose dehydrogenase family protein [Candidatus Hydrogenedentota bacterium]
MRVAVIGTGHVGLVVGTGLAETGHYVTCVDTNRELIAALNANALPFYEPGLEELVARNVEEERLRFTTDIESAISDVLLIFICVGTPAADSGEADTSAVFSALQSIGKAMTGYRIIVNKSTCPVGTTEAIRFALKSLTEHPFDVVVNPEFLRQGAAVDDFMRPDRIIVGCDDVRVGEIMKEMYAPFLRTGKPLLMMGVRSAEMAKYAVNAMLATRISFMNEFARLCEAYGADISEVREGLAADSRIGASYLFPGVGFGGSCLPKDLRACAHLAANRGIPSPLIEAVSAVNESQQTEFVNRILAFYGQDIAKKRIALWGASFKPKTDDLRGGPALRVIDALLAAGASVSVYDPVAEKTLKAQYGDKITIAPKNYAALEGADGLVICTEWNEFRRPDYERMANLLRERVIFDGRNLYTGKSLAQHGFRYFSIGRPAV